MIATEPERRRKRLFGVAQREKFISRAAEAPQPCPVEAQKDMTGCHLAINKNGLRGTQGQTVCLGTIAHWQVVEKSGRIEESHIAAPQPTGR
jgi:hypothetical protein